MDAPPSPLPTAIPNIIASLREDTPAKRSRSNKENVQPMAPSLPTTLTPRPALRYDALEETVVQAATAPGPSPRPSGVEMTTTESSAAPAEQEATEQAKPASPIDGMDALELVDELQGRLSLALLVVQLHLGAKANHKLGQIEASVLQTSVISQSISEDVHRMEAAQDDETFRRIIAWLSPPDPNNNQVAARSRHNAQTGSWLLQSSRYRRWKSCKSGHVWLHREAGCGKTILCSTVIEDVRRACNGEANTECAVFYFSCSDVYKQSCPHLLSSLLLNSDEESLVAPSSAGVRQI
ncbi:hypothetical protein LTR74_017153 [Friedmanniomyces endolithicus]|nr:hypothetical protein LTR74_017153 [Friedmanniomyces endolithicus]